MPDLKDVLGKDKDMFDVDTTSHNPIAVFSKVPIHHNVISKRASLAGLCFLLFSCMPRGCCASD